MTGTPWAIAVGAESVSAVYEGPTSAGDRRIVFACAHGAGGNMMDRGMLATANALRKHGIGVTRFNFSYTEKKSGRPDPMPKLMDCVSAVVEYVRAEIRPDLLLIGGRSMGGRAASMLAANGFTADGLLLLAYPLHPAGQPEKLRDAHLPAITMPVLCVNGTRDALCTKSLMEEVLRRVGMNWTMHWEEGADHSFHVLKSSGRTDPEVMENVAATAESWARAL
ncbi:MAG TPA: alpha/beta family hydrolase [Gemmatimonadaceae bacterium]|nr:alpha/beta family hydrolase [Gemmatimonadaceae bacterium]